MTERILLTVDEAADALSLGRSKVYEEINAGRLRSVKVGRARRIPSAALDEYVEALSGSVEP
jgi:excisionase family DNA binding protein